MGKTGIEKHKNRFKNFITYDLENRKVEEQQEVLKAIIEVAEDILGGIKSKDKGEI